MRLIQTIAVLLLVLSVPAAQADAVTLPRDRTADRRRPACARYWRPGRIEGNGLIDDNSCRGYRGYRYHTLGAESALGYALLARRFGFDLFADGRSGPSLQNLAAQTVNGGRD